jgi:hypothetical protein
LRFHLFRRRGEGTLDCWGLEPSLGVCLEEVKGNLKKYEGGKLTGCSMVGSVADDVRSGFICDVVDC